MLRSFLYVDEYKVFSLSSQIFEGLTEHVIRTQETGKSASEEQRGMIGSGQTLADIASERIQTSEKRFLHDYAYSLLEKRLIQDKVIRNIDNVDAALDISQNNSIVRVKSRAFLVDYAVLHNLMINLNELGASSGFVEKFEAFKLEKAHATASERGRANQGPLNLKSKKFIEQCEKELMAAIRNEPNVSTEFANRLASLFEFGFGSSLEIMMNIDADDGRKAKFSAMLDRKYLRQDAAFLERKYARETSEELTLVGIVTQHGPRAHAAKSDAAIGDQLPFTSIKEAMFELINKMTSVEKTFRGVDKNESIIDVIAIYQDLGI